MKKAFTIPTIAIIGIISLSSCISQYQYYTKTSTIQDITYETVLLDDAGHVRTTAYFLLDDGTLVPISSNFNPNSTDTYVGKTLRYEYMAKESQEAPAALADYSEYICQRKYVSDGKFYLKVFTDKKPAIKTIQVNQDAYNRAREGQHILKSDIEPYIKK